METFYLVVVIALFALAISDLIVGVSNDAVNFLNSAIGSKAAPKWAIFSIAALGVFIGATFSGGMMEVARKGIFSPEMFFFEEIMLIFLAVMLTDVILLDIFNTLGLPTSTTVSIVFELLGSAVAIAMIKISSQSDGIANIYQYINSEKALAIISGILISVVIAFTIGALVQWLTRLVFTFNYEKSIKFIGAPFGGISIAAIVYFIVIKGAKGATWIDPETLLFIKSNTSLILSYSFIISTVLLQILIMLFKRFNVLKLVVMLGTFALAMAFAGNDLVNFIGVPLAGFDSYKAWISAGMPSQGVMSMEILKAPVHTDTYMLLIAGLVMITTLITSKKAKNVVATSLNLSSQGDADEKFTPSPLSRAIVKSSINISKGVDKVLGNRVCSAIDSRFKMNIPAVALKKEDRPAFDLVRAAINLVVASILISFGTMLKLPLSTTYVTFMVAMGTSFADRAWDRESAVYRVSGVFTVIGGWFVTAFVAFVVAGTVATTLYFGGTVVVYIMISLALFFTIRSHTKGDDNKTDSDTEEEIIDAAQPEEVVLKSSKRLTKAFTKAAQLIQESTIAFAEEDAKRLKHYNKDVADFNKRSKRWKSDLSSVIKSLDNAPIEYSQYFIQAMDQIREISYSLSHIVPSLYEHLNNAHNNFDTEQQNDIQEVCRAFTKYMNRANSIIYSKDFNDIPSLIDNQQEIISIINTIEKSQIRRLKSDSNISTKSSLLFFGILSEIRSITQNTFNGVKAYRDMSTSI